MTKFIRVPNAANTYSNSFKITAAVGMSEAEAAKLFDEAENLLVAFISDGAARHAEAGRQIGYRLSMNTSGQMLRVAYDQIMKRLAQSFDLKQKHFDRAIMQITKETKDKLASGMPPEQVEAERREKIEKIYQQNRKMLMQIAYENLNKKSNATLRQMMGEGSMSVEGLSDQGRSDAISSAIANYFNPESKVFDPSQEGQKGRSLIAREPAFNFLLKYNPDKAFKKDKDGNPKRDALGRIETYSPTDFLNSRMLGAHKNAVKNETKTLGESSLDEVGETGQSQGDHLVSDSPDMYAESGVTRHDKFQKAMQLAYRYVQDAEKNVKSTVGTLENQKALETLERCKLYMKKLEPMIPLDKEMGRYEEMIENGDALHPAEHQDYDELKQQFNQHWAGLDQIATTTQMQQEVLRQKQEAKSEKEYAASMAKAKREEWLKANPDEAAIRELRQNRKQQNIPGVDPAAMGADSAAIGAPAPATAPAGVGRRDQREETDYSSMLADQEIRRQKRLKALQGIYHAPPGLYPIDNNLEWSDKKTPRAKDKPSLHQMHLAQSENPEERQQASPEALFIWTMTKAYAQARDEQEYFRRKVLMDTSLSNDEKSDEIKAMEGKTKQLDRLRRAFIAELEADPVAAQYSDQYLSDSVDEKGNRVPSRFWRETLRQVGDKPEEMRKEVFNKSYEIDTIQRGGAYEAARRELFPDTPWEHLTDEQSDQVAEAAHRDMYGMGARRMGVGKWYEPSFEGEEITQAKPYAFFPLDYPKDPDAYRELMQKELRRSRTVQKTNPSGKGFARVTNNDPRYPFYVAPTGRRQKSPAPISMDGVDMNEQSPVYEEQISPEQVTAWKIDSMVRIASALERMGQFAVADRIDAAMQNMMRRG